MTTRRQILPRKTYTQTEYDIVHDGQRYRAGVRKYYKRRMNKRQRRESIGVSGREV